MLHVFSKLGISLLINIIPDPSWHGVINHMSAHIKWGTNISERIPVQCGTKQGGFTSPFIFNVFYEDLINTLQN